MATERVGRNSRVRRRGPLLAAVVVLALAALLIGGRLDDAPTEGRYRPTLPPPAFSGVCNPLPDDVRLDLPYVVRADRTLTVPSGDQVRRLDLHYDLVDAATAERRVVDALEGGGFTEIDAPAGADPDIQRWFERQAYGQVGVGVTAFDVDADSVVRGAIALDVPSDTLTPEVLSACANPQQTKRYPEYADAQSSEGEGS